MKKAWALDLHGIINTAPEFLAAQTQSLVKDGWEIHVLTGSHIKEKGIEEELKRYGIAYTHLFSIADYHRENKTPGMWHDEKGNPWVSDEDWDKAKALYCKKHEIPMCIDDTARYARQFETPFAYMAIQKHKNSPNKYLNLVIEMFEARRKKKISYWNNLSNWINKNVGWFFSPAYKQGKELQNGIYK